MQFCPLGTLFFEYLHYPYISAFTLIFLPITIIFLPKTWRSCHDLSLTFNLDNFKMTEWLFPLKSTLPTSSTLTTNIWIDCKVWRTSQHLRKYFCSSWNNVARMLKATLHRSSLTVVLEVRKSTKDSVLALSNIQTLAGVWTIRSVCSKYLSIFNFIHTIPFSHTCMNLVNLYL